MLHISPNGICGIILCKSGLDQASCISADKVRAIRQKEYATAVLYTDSVVEQSDQKKRLQCNFIFQGSGGKETLK